jgi:hypothetical protein
MQGELALKRHLEYGFVSGRRDRPICRNRFIDKVELRLFFADHRYR